MSVKDGDTTYYALFLGLLKLEDLGKGASPILHTHSRYIYIHVIASLTSLLVKAYERGYLLCVW